MKVAIIPDSAMIILNPVIKSKHQLLSNFERMYREEENQNMIEECRKDVHKSSKKTYGIPNLNLNIGNKYCGSETPSGVVGRMSKIGPIIDEADAVVMITGKSENHMYNTLNELILFGGSACVNSIRLIESYIEKRGIPFLKLDYPNTREDIINIIDEENNFLNYLTELEEGKTNKKYKIIHKKERINKKINLNEFKKIIEDMCGD